MRKKSVKGPKIQKRNSPASSGVLALSPGGDGDDLLGRDGPRVRPWFWTVCALACSIVDILGTLTWLHVPLDLTTPFLWVLILAQTLLPLVFVGGILSTNMDDRRGLYFYIHNFPTTSYWYILSHNHGGHFEHMQLGYHELSLCLLIAVMHQQCLYRHTLLAYL